MTGAAHLGALGFPPRVCRLVGGHVQAKRYLVATDAAYAARLSPGSAATLRHQGGPMTAQEAAAFVPDDGVLFAAKGLAAVAAAARKAGAELSTPERMLEVEETPAGVRVTTDRRVIEADLAVLAVGPWATTLLEPLGFRLPLAPAIGQVSYWRGGGAWERRPSLVDFYAPDTIGVYGLPTLQQCPGGTSWYWRTPWQPASANVPSPPLAPLPTVTVLAR